MDVMMLKEPHEVGEICHCEACTEEARAEMARLFDAGICPHGYGACYHGPLCDGPPHEGSTGCAYTRPPR